MNVRQVDRMRWADQRCLLTRVDLEGVPKGTSGTQMLNWAGDATHIVNTFLRGLQSL